MAHRPSSIPLLAFKNVTVMRGEHAALQDITLRVEAGEHVCILGPNGCGKSTLIKTITRECYPLANEGSSVSILGRERWNVFELRSLLGIVSPDLLASCTTDATGRDVVLSGFFSSTRIFPITRPMPIFSGPTFTSRVAMATIPRLERIAFYCVRQGKQKTKGGRLSLETCPRDGWPPCALPDGAASSLQEEMPRARSPAAARKIPVQFPLCRRVPDRGTPRGIPAPPPYACAAAVLCSRW